MTAIGEHLSDPFYREDVLIRFRTILYTNLQKAEVDIEQEVYNCLYNIMSSTYLDLGSIPTILDLQEIIRKRRETLTGIFIEHTLTKPIHVHEKTLEQYQRQLDYYDKFKTSTTKNIFEPAAPPLLRIIEPPILRIV